MKKLWHWPCLAFVFSSVGGCATAMSGHSTTVIPIANAAPSSTFVIAKVSKEGVLYTERDIIAALLTGMRMEIPELGPLPSSPGFGPDTNSFGGVSLEYSAPTSSFEASWKWQQALNHNFLTASIPVQIQDNGRSFTVTLTCPSTLNSDVTNYSLVGIPKWSAEGAGKSITAACLARPYVLTQMMAGL